MGPYRMGQLGLVHQIPENVWISSNGMDQLVLTALLWLFTIWIGLKWTNEQEKNIAIWDVKIK